LEFGGVEGASEDIW